MVVQESIFILIYTTKHQGHNKIWVSESVPSQRNGNQSCWNTHAYYCNTDIPVKAVVFTVYCLWVYDVSNTEQAL